MGYIAGVGTSVIIGLWAIIMAVIFLAKAGAVPRNNFLFFFFSMVNR